MELGDLRDEFREDRRRSPRGERRRGSYFTPIGTEALALVVTQTDRPTQNRAIVLLNRAVLFERVIPARLREYVAGLSALDYDVWIRDATDAGKIVYSSAPVANLDDLTDVDVAIDLEIPDHLDLEIPDRLDRRSDEAHLLSVFLRHQAGSLEAAVSQIRRRNLLTSLGILALLGATVVVLTVATRRAQDLADQQMAFVAGVSHELRTPITGISSLSQNLADGIVQDSGKTETYGKAIHGESRRLADMVERLLQFSAQRSGKRRHEPRPVTVQDLIAGAIDAMGPALSTKYRFEQVIEDPLPPVLGDERGVKSAIQNLMSNAMKFSDPGDLIRLSTRAVVVGDRREVQIEVEDHGRGIPPAEQSHVFEPFFRGETARADQVQGSGLGLSLVKDIMETHGGRVTLVSAPGSGSTFTLHLPVAQMSAEEAARDDQG